MIGYIFETTNNKTGEKYLGKRYSVSFDKKYLGEDDNEALAKSIEKFGRPAFEVKMIMPYESRAEIDNAFEAMNKEIKKPAQKVVIEEEKPAPRRKRKSEE